VANVPVVEAAKSVPDFVGVDQGQVLVFEVRFSSEEENVEILQDPEDLVRADRRPTFGVADLDLGAECILDAPCEIVETEEFPLPKERERVEPGHGTKLRFVVGDVEVSKAVKVSHGTWSFQDCG
jgi:hypothetical protein